VLTEFASLAEDEKMHTEPLTADALLWFQGVGSIATALSFLAVSSYYFLDVSRKRRDANRKQAQQVDAWIDIVDIEGSKAHVKIAVSNKSDQALRYAKFELFERGKSNASKFCTIPAIPPTIERKFQIVKFDPIDLGEDVRLGPELLLHTFEIALQFTDAAGEVWVKNREGVLDKWKGHC
jgi:hypothetical protein